MHFRRHRSGDSSAGQTSPSKEQSAPNKPDQPYTPKTLEEILALSRNQSKQPRREIGSSDESHPLSDSSRSDRSLENRKFTIPPRRVPTSRKTGFATIRTDSTDTHAAFESDAFAVLMPTTRLPILDHPITPKRASPAARAEAYRTYLEKARQVREKNKSHGVQVPSKVVSYGHIPSKSDGYQASLEVELSPPNSPTPAGSFPKTPPISQYGWARPQKTPKPQVKPFRHVRQSPVVTPPRKPPTAPSSTTSTNTYYRVYRPTVVTSTSPPSSSTSPSTTIKVRVKPNTTTQVTERVQTESTYNLYNRPLPASPPYSESSRSSSPVKSMPNFTRHNSVEGDSIFGYRTKDFAGTIAGAAQPSSSDKDTKAKEKEKEKDKPILPKRSLTSRWPWLRPSGPRVAKPIATPVISKPTAHETKHIPSTSRGYIDPFTRHATPVIPSILTPPPPPPIPAPKKLSRPSTPPTPKFDTGFAQITSFFTILVKTCLLLYAIVALYFILDAVREAFHTLGAPIRVARWAGGWGWVGIVWAARWVARNWSKWGFVVRLKGGWVWGGRWW